MTTPTTEKPNRRQIEKLAVSIPAVDTLLRLHQAGLCSYEQALEEMVVVLAADAEAMRKIATDCVSREAPAIFTFCPSCPERKR